MTQWETFTQLVKEGRDPADIAETFGLPDAVIRRVLALGNLLPRIRQLYRAETIDRVTVRHLTLASKSQQKAWLALLDDPDSRAPTGHQLKAWLFGGQSISAVHALFDLDTYAGATVADLFGDDRYFADADAFWVAQNAAIAERREAFLEAGWREVVIVPPADHFSVWEHEKAAKRKGGRVYIDVRASGEVMFHEGYVTRKEVRSGGANADATTVKPARPELTSTLQTYVDLHRHAAVRARLLAHPQVALRLMVAHVVAGSPLWSLKPEPQSTRSDEVRESVETCLGETAFDERRRAVLALLGLDPEALTVVRGYGNQGLLPALFARLVALPDALVLEVAALTMGETLMSGSTAVEAVGAQIGIDMADWWSADDALFDNLRDREVLVRMVAEVAGETVAAANATEKTKTLKRIIRDHLDGKDGRPKVERWVPKWMAFPPAAHTARGGVGTVKAAAMVAAARAPERPRAATRGALPPGGVGIADPLSTLFDECPARHPEGRGRALRGQAHRDQSIMQNDDDIGRADRAKRGSPFLNTEQAAAWLKLSARQLKRLRRAGKGPTFRRHSRYVQYHIDDLDAWSRAHADREYEK